MVTQRSVPISQLRDIHRWQENTGFYNVKNSFFVEIIGIHILNIKQLGQFFFFSEDSIRKTYVPVFSCRFGSLAIVFKTLVPGSMDRNSRDKVGIYSYTDHKIKSTTVCFDKVFFQVKFSVTEIFSVSVQNFLQNLYSFCVLLFDFGGFKTTIESFSC